MFDLDGFDLERREKGSIVGVVGVVLASLRYGEQVNLILDPDFASRHGDDRPDMFVPQAWQLGNRSACFP